MYFFDSNYIGVDRNTISNNRNGNESKVKGYTILIKYVKKLG